jgi:hypothetical protein
LFNRELGGNILYLIERLHSCQLFTPWILLLGEEKRAWGNYTVKRDQGKDCTGLKGLGHEMNIFLRAYEIESVLCEYMQKVFKKF